MSNNRYRIFQEEFGPGTDFHFEPLHGNNPTEVVNLIRQRINGQRDDSRKLGLVLEGGGMRAAISAGGALALDHIGARHAFDEVFTTSAAVMNGAYLISGQGNLGISVYFEDLIERRFCNFARPWKIIDVDFVIDEVITQRKPLDTQAVRDVPPRLHLAMMDADTGDPHVVDTETTEHDLIELLRAALAIPVFYNRPVEVGAKRYVDGGLRHPFPVEPAIAAGCTDLLVLLSQPSDFVLAPFSLFTRTVFKAMASRDSPKLHQAFLDAPAHSHRLRQLALGHKSSRPDVNIATLCTSSLASKVGTLSRNEVALRRASEHYYQNLRHALNSN